MDLDAVSFPALIVADDGWVDLIASQDRLSTWTKVAIGKYSKRRVVLLDHSDRAWQVESVVPQHQHHVLTRLAQALSNPRLAVCIHVRPITEEPMQAVQETLRAAIDADDDILTQHTDASELKSAVLNATSFQALVGVLRKARAI